MAGRRHKKLAHGAGLIQAISRSLLERCGASSGQVGASAPSQPPPSIVPRSSTPDSFSTRL